MLPVFFIALAARVAFLFAWGGNPFAEVLFADAREYHLWAVQMLQGRPLLELWPNHSPLYPMLISLVFRAAGTSLWTLYLVQAVLGAAAAWCCAKACQRLTADPVAAGVAGLAAALFWPFLHPLGGVLPQTLEIFLVSAALLALSSTAAPSPWAAVCAGVCLGLAGSARPQLVPAALALGLAVRFAWSDGTWKSAACLVVPAALISSLWGFYLAGHGLPTGFLQSAGGLNMYLGNQPGASGLAADFPGLEYAALRFKALKEGGGQADAFYLSAVWDWLKSDPAAFAGLWLRKLLLNLSASEIAAGEPQPWLVDGSFGLPRLLDFGLLLGLGLPGLALAARRSPGLARAAGLAFVVGLLALVPPPVAGRYRAPLLPLLALGAGLLAAWLRPELAARRWRTLAAAAAAGLALCLASHGAARLVPVDARRAYAIASAMRGLSLDADLARARELLEARAAAAPEDDDVSWHLALVQARQRDWPAAERTVSALASRRGTDYPTLFGMLAWLKAFTGDRAGAGKAASAAARADPSSLGSCLREVLFVQAGRPRQQAAALCRCPLMAPSRADEAAAHGLARALDGSAPVLVRFPDALLAAEEADWGGFGFILPPEDVKAVFPARGRRPVPVFCRGR
jgi:hypothetical protein